MKTSWLVSLLFSGSLFGAVEYDLQKGIDLTALTSVTASQLNQLVDKGTVGTNKGMIYYGSSAPDVASNSRYSRFIWLDSTTLPPVPKTYSNGTWYAASVTDGSITSAKLANSAVTEAKVASDAISEAKIATGAVSNSKLADGSVTSIKIVDGNVTDAKLAANSVTTAKILDYNVTGVKIAAASITNDKIATGGIVNSNLASGAVSGDKIAVNAITASNIASGGVALTNLSTTGASAAMVPTYSGSSVVWQTPVISTNYSVADGAALSSTPSIHTFAHNAGSIPTSYKLVAKCLSAEYGYQVGDEIPLTQLYAGSLAIPSWGHYVLPSLDATNVTLVFPHATAPSYYSKTNAATQVTFTAASWKAYIHVQK